GARRAGRGGDRLAGMATTYRRSRAQRFFNRLMERFVRAGRGPEGIWVLEVAGRKSGRRYSTPVQLVENGGRWLVSPYGPVSWVLNVRAAGQATLTRGKRHDTVTAVELGPKESAPVLRDYVRQVPRARPYVDASNDSPLEAFEVEAHKHPVFRLSPREG